MQNLIAFSEEDLKTLIREVVAEVLPKVQKEAVATNDLLTRNEAAKYLNVSMPTLRAWESKGFIKPKRIGSRVYFSKIGLESSKPQ